MAHHSKPLQNPTPEAFRYCQAYFATVCDGIAPDELCLGCYGVV
jgi:hypothetical protein